MWTSQTILHFIRRDLGEHLRVFVSAWFPPGESSTRTDPQVERQLKHLRNISEDVHKNAYPRRFPESSVLGLTQEELHGITDVNFMGNQELFDEYNKPIWRRIFTKKEAQEIHEQEKREREREEQKKKQ
jgi:hypothetical protein